MIGVNGVGSEIHLPVDTYLSQICSVFNSFVSRLSLNALSFVGIHCMAHSAGTADSCSMQIHNLSALWNAQSKHQFTIAAFKYRSQLGRPNPPLFLGAVSFRLANLVFLLSLMYPVVMLLSLWIRFFWGGMVLSGRDRESTFIFRIFTLPSQAKVRFE